MRFERMPHRVALFGRYFVLVASRGTNYRRLNFHLSKIGGFVTLRPCNMGQFFPADILKTPKVLVNGACIPLAVQD